MTVRSDIEWTDATWNPVRGCNRVSPGCGGPGPHGGCYAEIMAARFSKPGQWGHGFAEMKGGDHRWTGKVALIEKMLTLPMHWKEPRKIFVNSTSDLFHPALSDDDIDRVFAVMAVCERHTMQVLTKRPERARAYINAPNRTLHIAQAGAGLGDLWWGGWLKTWPLKNVWLGTSVEDQERADERIPHLLAAPAAVRFLSCEPLLGPVDLTALGHDGDGVIDALRGEDWIEDLDRRRTVVGNRKKLDWVIDGGESGPGSRITHPNNFRSLRDQCATAGTAYLHKQNGEWVPSPEIIDAKGTSFHKFDDGTWMQRVGKKAAGRLLDGVEHNGYPRAA